MNSILMSPVDDDVPPGIRAAAERIESRSRRASDGDPDLPRAPTWREIGAIIALVSMAFTVGYNWRELATLHADYDKQVLKNDDEHKTFKTRGESDIEYREIQRQLKEINDWLARADRRAR